MPNQNDDPKAGPPADPRSDPPADPPADPRARILAATVALLGEVGWGGVTTRKVAQRAKVNNALVHYYFGTKGKLLVEAATQVLLEQFGEPLALLADPEVEVSDAVAASVEWLGRADLDPTQLRALAEITINGLGEPDLARLSRTMLTEGRAQLAERLGREGFDRDRAEGAAVLVFALLDGLLLHRIIDPDLHVAAVAKALAPLWREKA